MTSWDGGREGAGKPNWLELLNLVGILLKQQRPKLHLELYLTRNLEPFHQLIHDYS